MGLILIPSSFSFRARYKPYYEIEFEEEIIMLTYIVLKLKLAKLKYYARKETKAFRKRDFEKAIKYGKLVSVEFDKIFG